LLIGAATIYLLDKQRINRLRKEQDVRMSLATNLNKDVNTTLRNINVLSEIAFMKSGKQPEQAKDYLKEIQSKSRDMVIVMDDVLWSIAPANDSMAKTIERFGEIAGALRTSSGKGIRIETSGSLDKLRLDMKTRLELLAVYKMILLLVVEELRASSTSIQLEYDRHLLRLTILSDAELDDLNDPVLKKRVNEITGRATAIPADLDIEQKTSGTAFSLALKV
jgi:glucose-6-phosphate-specific signal transduction histidine kinase